MTTHPDSLSPETWATIISEYLAGSSLGQLASRHGLNRNTLKSRLHRAGVKRGNGSPAADDTPNPLYIKDTGQSSKSSSLQSSRIQTTSENGQGDSPNAGEHVGGDGSGPALEALPAPSQVAPVDQAALPATTGEELARMVRRHGAVNRRFWREMRRLLDDAPSASVLETLSKVADRLVRLDRQAAGLDQAGGRGQASGHQGDGVRALVVPVIIAPPKAGQTPEGWREAVHETFDQAGRVGSGQDEPGPPERWRKPGGGEGG